MFPSMEELADSYRLEGIKNYITWGYGERCVEYYEGCPVCDEWASFDEYLETMQKPTKTRQG